MSREVFIERLEKLAEALDLPREKLIFDEANYFYDKHSTHGHNINISIEFDEDQDLTGIYLVCSNSARLVEDPKCDYEEQVGRVGESIFYYSRRIDEIDLQQERRQNIHKVDFRQERRQKEGYD